MKSAQKCTDNTKKLPKWPLQKLLKKSYPRVPVVRIEDITFGYMGLSNVLELTVVLN